MIFSLKLTMDPAAPPQLPTVVQEWFGRSTKRFRFSLSNFVRRRIQAQRRPSIRFRLSVESRWRIEAGLNIAKGGAGSAVEEDTVERIANSAAHRSEPWALGLARYRRCYDR
jgi:hypothetical protein